jgi:hypothetical protein
VSAYPARAWREHNRPVDDRDARNWQMETGAYRDRITQTAASAPGFAGGEVRSESHELLVFGVGEPTAALAAMMDEAPDTLRVSWHPAPYSLAELTVEVKRVMTANPGITTGGARHDGTGISFTTTDRSLLDSRDPQAALETLYPVTIEFGERPVPL